jgi:2-isopropylmalate synthase
MLNFEIIDATKRLAIARSLDSYKPPFAIVENYRLIDDGINPEATVQIEAHGSFIHEAATGEGPVDALASVLMKALTPIFPEIGGIKLVDYHAEIIDSSKGTATSVQVTITFTDGKDVWKVYSSSANINRSSFKVLVDGFEYAILKYMAFKNTK